MTTYTDQAYTLYGFDHQGKLACAFHYNDEAAWRKDALTIAELCPDWKISMVDRNEGTVNYLLRSVNI
jgi:hypothetical protein